MINAESEAVLGSEARARGFQAPQYQYGFIAPSDDENASPVYILVQIIYEDLDGVSKTELAKALGAIDLNEIEGVVRQGGINATMNQMVFNRQDSRFETGGLIQLEDDSTLTYRSFGFFGRNGLFNLHCYAPTTKFGDWNPVFEQIASTVSFDTDKKFRESSTSNTSSGSLWDRMLQKAAVGAVLGVIATVIVVVSQIGSRKNKDDLD